MRFLYKPSDPQIVDHWVDIAYICFWTFYAGWGVAAFIARIPTFSVVTPEWYLTLWSICIGLSALTAAVAASLSFFDGNMRVINKKSLELAATIVLIAFISIYPGLVTMLAILGDPDRIGVAIVSWSYLVFPLLRVHILRQRIRILRAEN